MATIRCNNCDETFEVDVRPQTVTHQVRKLILTFPSIDVPHECPNNTFAPTKTKAWRKPEKPLDSALSGRVDI